tara:strand:- start:161 stop:514 length:354 start_codon:yes stop_codon:yes gene_type:complete
MQLIISKDLNYNNKNKVFFSKAELQIILQTYSKQVSAGICKDYSIDHSKQKAIFSFFRNTFDKPIFQIEKKINVKSKILFNFSITYKQKIIETNTSLLKILKRLDKKFEFFQKNKKG